MSCTRSRDEIDVDACVTALRAVYETSGYPSNWPADPAQWLRPPGMLQAWVADWTAPDGRPVTLHRYAWSRGLR
jgi:hypothetical protein